MRMTAFVLVAVGVVVAGADARPPAAWTTVSGQVVLPPDVPVPAPKLLPGPVAGVPDESLIVNPKNRGIKNVVVWLRPNNKDPKAKFAADEIHPADAKRAPRPVLVAFTPRLVFAPRALTARVGDTVVIQNQSPQLANFQWFSANNGGVNVNLNAGQAFKTPVPLVAETPPIAFKSVLAPADGYLRIFEHPYYAVTDADGNFELKDAPVGDYRLVYWHERVGFKDGKEGRFGDPITIAPGKAGPLVAFDVTK